MPSSCLRSSLIVLALVSLPAAARAAEPAVGETIAPAQLDPFIVGGVEASPCQWPTSVGFSNSESMCSGTLVHPRVVLTAAHCIVAEIGGPPSAVVFGESLWQPAFTVAVESCLANPEFEFSTTAVGPDDYAYCVLAQAVDLPPTPPLMGCELDELSAEREVAIVGFGRVGDQDEQAGVKHWAMMQVNASGFPGMVSVGDMMTSTCSGDSGSTGYVRLQDGGWRSWGILSGGPEGCPNEGYYVPMASMVAWVEAESGFDITPCHDADGTWNPGPSCTGLAADPSAGGSWNEGCPGALGGEPATCGPGLSARDDFTGPSVGIVSPADGAVFAESPAVFDIEVKADDAPGFAVLRVEIYVDGELVAERERPANAEQTPWLFNDAQFSRGSFTLEARAYDYFGNLGESTPVVVQIGEAPAQDDGDGSEDEPEAQDDGGSDSGGPALDASPVGCSCRAGVAPGGAAILPLLLVVLGCCRRRASRD